MGSQFKPTNTPFWADVTVSSNIKQNLNTNFSNNTNKHMNIPESKQIQESLQELTDDNSPSVPFAESNAQAHQGIQTTKKPVLNIQERTQERIKSNQKYKEKPNNVQVSMSQNVMKDLKQNMEDIQDAKQNLQQNREQDKKQIEKLDNKLEKNSPVNEINNQNQAEICEKTNIVQQHAEPIPVLSSQTCVNISNQNNLHSAGMAIPTLSNQDNKMRHQAPVQLLAGQQNIYQNIHGTEVPNILTINNMAIQEPMVLEPMRVQRNYQVMPAYQNLNATPGVPLSFLRQQQMFGAFKSQNTYVPINSAPVYPMPIKLHQSMFVQQPAHPNYMSGSFAPNATMFLNTAMPIPTSSQAYSSSDLLVENREKEIHKGSSPPDMCLLGQKRLSAFKRLGPLTQAKKPKLTINLCFDKAAPVREVVGEIRDNVATELFVPVHEKKDIVNSADEIVKKYLIYWPWKNYVHVKRSVGARSSKSAMMMEQEQMEELYKNDNAFIQVTVKGYPKTWSKEDVLDTLVENLQGKSFIPCFIEFSPHECKFLVLKCRTALLAIHKLGFRMHKDGVMLNITISNIDLTLKHIDFLPKLILRKRVLMGLDSKTKLSLKAFTLQPDISHFLYFPLNCVNHQMDLVALDCYFDMKNLVEIDLSNNRLATLEGFNLQQTTPHLRNLDVSNNYIEKITVLINCRNLPIISLKLEGNPLCTDYRDPDYYIKVLKMIFPMLKELDGVSITLKGDIPLVRKNFCLSDADVVVEKFLETFFPIIDNPPHERDAIEQMYDDNAILTITHQPKLTGLTSVYREFRSLFPPNHYQGTNEKKYIKSPQNIIKLLRKWPDLLHDPATFTVDVMWHSDSTTLLRVGGVVKITSKTLAIDEHILAFSRTILLHTTNGFEYKIRNEMLYWDLPTEDFTKNAFRITVPKKILNIALETPPDKITKENLIQIFMILTELEKTPSKRCLEKKEWNLKDALSFFTKLVKLNHIDILYDVIPTEPKNELYI